MTINIFFIKACREYKYQFLFCQIASSCKEHYSFLSFQENVISSNRILNDFILQKGSKTVKKLKASCKLAFLRLDFLNAEEL